jgi:hypothetical protein
MELSATQAPAKKGGKRSKKVVVEAAGVEAAVETAGVESTQPLYPTAPAAPAAAEKKPKAKKDKKPVQVVAVVTPDGIEGTFTPEPRRPLIVNLPFRSGEVMFGDTEMRYDPSPPPSVQPYDTDGQVYFQVNTEGTSDENQIGVDKEGWKMQLEGVIGLPSATTQQQQQQPQAKVEAPAPAQENFTRLLSCYSSKPGETFRVPATTEVACFWCTHEFNNQPCFLPVKEESGTYHVYGNFCSPQCGLSYLLHEHLDSHVRWERMSLLHRMYRPHGKPGSRLYPAPPRESLKKFGGVYSHEQFRRVVTDNKVRVDVQIPPMVSILGTLDTKPIDFYDSSLQNTFTGGFSMDRFKAWSEQGGALRLKRSKPLKDKESTLDSCIQFSVKRG